MVMLSVSHSILSIATCEPVKRGFTGPMVNIVNRNSVLCWTDVQKEYILHGRLLLPKLGELKIYLSS